MPTSRPPLLLRCSSPLRRIHRSTLSSPRARSQCVKFLTKYAYTFVVLENRGFCSACSATFGLLEKHGTQVTLNTMVQMVLFWIQSVATPALVHSYRR